MIRMSPKLFLVLFLVAVVLTTSTTCALAQTNPPNGGGKPPGGPGQGNPPWWGPGGGKPPGGPGRGNPPTNSAQTTTEEKPEAETTMSLDGGEADNWRFGKPKGPTPTPYTNPPSRHEEPQKKNKKPFTEEDRLDPKGRTAKPGPEHKPSAGHKRPQKPPHKPPPQTAN